MKKLKKSDPEYFVQQSINQKVERSEKDIINSLEWTLGALFLLQLTTFVLILANI